MKSFLVKVLVNAVALWVATLVVSGIDVGAPGDPTGDRVLTYLLVGLVFGLVNAFVKPVVKFFTLPFYVLTLGLLTFVVNAFMLQITEWIADVTALSFTIDEFWPTAVLAAVVITFVSLVLHAVLPDGKDD